MMNALSSKNALKLEVVDPLTWDAVAADFADIIPEQTGIFNAGHWGADKTESLILRDGNEVVGGGAIIVRGIPFTSTGIAVMKWGPVWRKSDSGFDAELYQASIQALIAEYCDRRGFHLTIMPPAVAQLSDPMCDELEKMGFWKGTGVPAPERYIVNTHEVPDKVMASFDQKWRYNLRKSLKHDLQISFAEGEEGLASFLELYGKMIDRKGFLDSSAIDSLEHFFRNSHANVKPLIVLVSYEDSITAAGVFFTAGEMASYVFGATDDRALRLKAGYAMHWWLAQHLCEQPKVKWYDLGGNDLDAGLHQFKKGMVGKSGHILELPIRYHYATGLQAKLLGNAVFALRDKMNVANRLKHKLKSWFGQ